MANHYMTRSKTNTPKVHHDSENKQFFIEMNESNAFLSYTKCGNVIQMDHTEVPQVYGGRGLGKVLAKVRHVVCVQS